MNCYDCKKECEEYWRIYELDICTECVVQLFYFLKNELGKINGKG